jgi:hypothetical protein
MSKHTTMAYRQSVRMAADEAVELGRYRLGVGGDRTVADDDAEAMAAKHGVSPVDIITAVAADILRE